MNEMYFKYHQQLQEQQNTGVNVPSAPPTLNRSHYGLLLSGRPADEENGVTEIPPIFHISFSKEKNLRSWAACGAIPCTRQAQYHHTVRHELEPTEEQHDAQSQLLLHAEAMVEYWEDNFDRASKNM
jgi:hypothetical protein